jgi:fused signal recognition particle receptor
MGLLDRLKQRLVKTRTSLSDGLSSLFRGGRPIDDKLLGELEDLLYTADLGALASELVAELARKHKRGELKGEEGLREHLRASLLERLQEGPAELELTARPTVVLVVGVNGSGKTTSIAKLADRFREQGKRVGIAACDTFRAAAADQLAVWAERTGAELVRGKERSDPAAVAFDATDRAVREEWDLLLVDTAGRLHTQTNLMAELEKLRRVIDKRLPGAPHSVLLVLDGTNGQNAIAQAKQFTAAVEVDGLLVSKLDGTARGGSVFAIRADLGLPVRYLGTGETLEGLERFEPEAFVDALLGREVPSAR